jgi:hypothetical protein
MGSKILSLRDNRLKSSTSNKRNRVEFLMKRTKKMELCTIYQNCQNFTLPLFNAQITP